MPNNFLGQKRSRLWPTGMANWIPSGKVRLQDVLAVAFDNYKDPMEDKPSFITRNALQACLVRDISNNDWNHLTMILSFVFGFDMPAPMKITVTPEQKLQMIHDVITNNCAHVATIVSSLFVFNGTDVPNGNGKEKKKKR